MLVVRREGHEAALRSFPSRCAVFPSLPVVPSFDPAADGGMLVARHYVPASSVATSMTTNDQQEVIGFLESPATHHATTVERVDTHTSIVFLAGSRAYKLKRAVHFDYVDFSTLERRRYCCEAEVRLNRRTAPTLYKGVVPVVRSANGRLSLGGEGHVVEWLVEMRRFDQDHLLDRLAAEGRLDVDVMETLASSIVDLHRVAATRSDHGGAKGMDWVVEGNAASFGECRAEELNTDESANVIAHTRQELARQAVILERRRHTGYVRECHGDLHLRNVVLLDGRPTLFDGVEFNDEISCIDVLYDLAFLLMDLWRRRLTLHANVVLNRYVAESGELEGLSVLPLFLSCRAAVRAKTNVSAARVQTDAARCRELYESASDYLRMAGELLRPAKPFLIGIGGFSGSGKSSVAKAIAPGFGAPPGALVLRSDEIRKRLCGVSLLERLGPEGYTADVSRRVYETLAQSARSAVLNGRAVVADAVFADHAQRRMIERVGSDLGVPFVGCWLSAPVEVLVARAEQRQNDPSDADAAVVHRQHSHGTEQIDWPVVDATGTKEAVVQVVSALLSHAVR
jgi:aminoglycoside phosphotransferase family enzyme/predicted kinase